MQNGYAYGCIPHPESSLDLRKHPQSQHTPSAIVIPVDESVQFSGYAPPLSFHNPQTQAFGQQHFGYTHVETLYFDKLILLALMPNYEHIVIYKDGTVNN